MEFDTQVCTQEGKFGAICAKMLVARDTSTRLITDPMIRYVEQMPLGSQVGLFGMSEGSVHRLGAG